MYMSEYVPLPFGSLMAYKLPTNFSQPPRAGQGHGDGRARVNRGDGWDSVAAEETFGADFGQNVSETNIKLHEYKNATKKKRKGDSHTHSKLCFFNKDLFFLMFCSITIRILSLMFSRANKMNF